VKQGSLALAERLAAQTEVQGLYPTVQYTEPVVSAEDTARTAAAVEWGVAAIRADQVWSQYGARGAGITVANIDTGVQYDHPALAKQYRGYQPDGTVDHDYNWFDAAGQCGGAPCDLNGHGTHTMGTMAGDDGAGNQVGVAPGVRWIAANGCCPDDTALIRSGEWMLLPTDSNGQNPDAAKRPNIINNSWGSGIPGPDPFMQDITRAWAASGIFGVWSNGNLGPGCDTASAPGSMIGNYSVGAYDESGTVADFSSRGSGENGEVKPNVSAPGVDVRSSLPGNRFGTASGTSMAAPHVAGAIALLWSAAPGLVGDIDTTRALLDGSALDAADDSCDGTASDNNVYGEGRLDALGLVDRAPVGDTGTVDFAIRDDRTGARIGAAELNLTGPVDRVRQTGADGNYSMPLPPGRYTVRVSAWGYHPRTTTVTIRAGRTSDVRVELDAQTRVDVSGTVRDGSGHGWGLYARITVAGMPGGVFYTRPSDGRYKLRLPVGATYTLTVEPLSAGHRGLTQDVAVGNRDVRRDFALTVDAHACAAPGFGYSYDGAGTSFDTGLPGGWTVVDHLGNGEGWRFDDPGEVGNLTGGTGVFARGQSPGNRVPVDTSLVSPPIDLSGQSDPVVGFKQDLGIIVENADVDISLDGGTTWQTVLNQNRSARGPREETVPIPQAANRSDVRVRFHYHVATFNSWWWQLDDVYVGARGCAAQPGDLVVGQVRDRNTGRPVNGATVTVPGTTGSVRSVATPADPAVEDGFYSVFVPHGRRDLTATAGEYRPATERVRDNEIDFRLPAGRIAVDPGTVSATTKAGGVTTRTFTVRNTGTAPVEVSFREQLRAGGVPSQAGLDQPGAPVVRIEGEFSPLGFDASARGSHESPESVPASPWVDLADYPTRIMDNAVGEYGGLVYSVGGVDGDIITAKGYVYDPAAKTWSPIADLPHGRQNAAGAFIGDTFYVTGGWGEDVRAVRSTIAYDRTTNTWRQLADGPVAAAAAGRAVLDGKLYLVGGCTNACGMTEVRRYDPATDAWQSLADYPEPTAHLACGDLDGRLYCAGGTSRGVHSKHTYAYDPATNTWTRKADLPTRLWGMAYTASYDRLLLSGGTTGTAITNQGFAYLPQTDTWIDLPASGNVLYRGGSACGLHRIGGSIVSGFNPVKASELLPTYGDCAPADVPWLSAPGGTVTLAPGRSTKVTVHLEAPAKPGTLQAGLWIKENTPYLTNPVGVTLTVR
jgi:subtilisin family serine protease/N-acetylneuraminic acid mutarotase